jgi:cytochrome c
MLLKSMMAGLAIAVVAAGTAAAAECTLPADAQAGPNIHDVFGRKAGTRADFTKYSEAMQGASGKGLVWTDDKIFEYLADPHAFLAKVNGADMKHAMFFQLKDDQKRKDVIAFLKAIKDKPECN